MKTYSFKLYNSKRLMKLHRQINAAGMTYNHCIALHRRYYRLYKCHLSCYALQRHLTKLKKIKRFAYLKEFGSQAVHDVAERIDRAYRKFFNDLKRGVKTAPPKFKKVRKYKSFTLKQSGYKFLEDNTVEINKQRYRYFKSREIEGRIKTVTVKRDALRDIYVYIVCESEKNQAVARTGKSVGYDFGLKSFLTDDTGTSIASPLFFSQGRKAIASANKKLSRKKEGSHNRHKARLALARLHKRVANRRNNFHWEQASRIAGEYSL
ncbi:MAG: transposase, partial [Desulfovibrionaceae bacterium]|nr:transposase [Desulfovibrionaceae bacterium]